MHLATSESDAAREGFYRTRDPQRNKQRWAVKCDTCGTERIWNMGDNAPIEFLKNAFHNAGWVRHKDQCTCPNCVKEAKMNKHVAPAAEVVAINPKIQRKVFSLLDEHFDEDKRLYRLGWSDAAIAKEADTSEAFVVQLRRGAYGELAEDPHVTALKKDIASLGQEITDLGNDLLAKMGALEARQKELESRMSNLAFRGVKAAR